MHVDWLFYLRSKDTIYCFLYACRPFNLCPATNLTMVVMMCSLLTLQACLVGLLLRFLWVSCRADLSVFSLWKLWISREYPQTSMNGAQLRQAARRFVVLITEVVTCWNANFFWHFMSYLCERRNKNISGESSLSVKGIKSSMSHVHPSSWCCPHRGSVHRETFSLSVNSHYSVCARVLCDSL